MECTHRFQVDSQNIGTCSLCGEIRQFPYDKGEPVKVLKKGSPNHLLSNDNKPDNQRRTGMHRHEGKYPKKHRYYEDNKEAIIADLLSQGRSATRKKWNIPKGSLGRLERKWLTEEQRLKLSVNPDTPPGTPEPPHPSTTSAPSNGRLPPFPPFSDNWEPEVQLSWIDAYRALATNEKPTLATTNEP
jgi:hypothetical protein